jgi:DNA-directed RNA polymerase specialized sigma24 family protein
MPCSPAKIAECRKFEAKASALYAQRLSTYQIAERFGCSQGKVAKALQRAGVKMRGFSEAVSLSYQS